MDIKSIHSFLVHPGKNSEVQSPIRGAAVQGSGQLFEMLRRIFERAEGECQHDVVFVSDTPDQQQNECRDCLLAYVRSRTEAAGRKVASRLQMVTTNRSGLGLLFLIIGEDKAFKKLVVSRFPADNGILAEEGEKALTVQFLERVFMKSATAYKAATYSGKSIDHDFWKGKAVDKQINSSESTISNYWIRDFLRSDFLTPGEAGTRRVALAVRAAMNQTSDVAVKEEIAALCKLIPGLKGRATSASEIVEQYGLSDATKAEIKRHFNREVLYTDKFRFVPEEFASHLAFTTVELSNGGLLTGPSEKFSDIFQKEVLNKHKNVVRFTTQGEVVDQRFRKSR